MTSRGRALAALSVAAGLLAAPVAAAHGALLAGAASADITPPIGTPMFAYTARSGIANPDNLPPVLANLLGDPGSGHYAKTFVPSVGIHIRVRSRALVLKQDGKTWALVQADLGGLPYTLTQDVLDRVADLGITSGSLLLSATHTHSSAGPIWPTESNVGYAALGGDLFDPRVYGEVRDGIVSAIRQAYRALEPATAGYAASQVSNASRNRSYDQYLRDPETPKDPVQARLRSIDPDVTVLRVDSTSGAPIAVWSNFAVHPTSFGDDNLLFSGDNAGAGARLAEERITAAAARAGKPPRRPFVDVWANSAQGDISPNGDPDKLGTQPVQTIPNAFASANLAGDRQAKGIYRAWRAAGSSMSRSLQIDSRRTLIAFDGTPADGEPVGPLQSLGYGGVIGDEGVCSPLGAVNIPGQAPKLPAVSGILLAPSSAQVSVWRIGDLGILAVPAELTKTLGERVRAASMAAAGGLFKRVVVAGLTNGYVSYTTTPEEYDFCGYEGSFTLFGRQEGARWRDALDALDQDMLHGRPSPAGTLEPARLRLGIGGGGPRRTPNAGKVVKQPRESVARMGRATFSWTGGDPAVDAPHGRAFVTLERSAGKGRWTAVGTDDGLRDTTELAGGTWTDTWQFDECDKLGTYRFHVTGDADKGSGVKEYGVVSSPFELKPAPPLSVGKINLTPGGVAQVLVTYPDPGRDALLALPHLLRTGSVRIVYRKGSHARSKLAKKPKGTAMWSARLGRGARQVSVVSARDHCGNSA